VTGTTPRARTRPIAANPDGSARSRGSTRAERGPLPAQRVVVEAPVELDRHRRGVGEARGIQQQTVGDVHHRGRTRVRRHGPRPIGGAGRSCAARSSRSAAVSAAGSTGIGVPAASRNRSNSSASPRAAPRSPRRRRRHPGAPRPQHGLGAVEHADRRHGDRQDIGCREVAPSTPQPGASASHASRRPRARSATNDTDVASGARARRTAPSGRAHRGDVGEVDRRRLPAEVVAARPREPEVRSVHERVGRDDDASPGAESTAASSPGPTSARDEPCSAARRAPVRPSRRGRRPSRRAMRRALRHPSTVAWRSVPTARAALVLVVAAVAALSPAARRPSR
jgi:hypothetical protein